MADRDARVELSEELAARAVWHLENGMLFTSVEEVLEAALEALEREQAEFAATLRGKVEEALADPRPPVPIEEAFAWLDERKALRRK